MGADQHLVTAFQERAQSIDLAAIIGARCIAQVPTWLHMPVGPEAVAAQWLVVKARTDGFFRHHDDGLLDVLVRQLIQRNEHQGPAFTGCRRRFDQQVLLTTPLEDALLHGAHAQFVGLGGAAVLGIGDGNGRNALSHDHASIQGFLPVFLRVCSSCSISLRSSASAWMRSASRRC